MPQQPEKSGQEYHVTEAGSEAIVDRSEIRKKIEKTEAYIRRVEGKIKQLEKQILELQQVNDDEALVEKGLELFDLKNKLSDQV